MPLNAKQKLFVQEYLLDKNATRAAIAAGYAEGSAASTGPRLTENDEIKSAIEKGLKEQARKIEARVDREIIFTKAMWLRELRLIALSNIDDFITIEAQEVYTDTDTGKKVYNITANPIPTKSRRHKGLGRAIKKISETKNGIGIELHSKQAALDTLGKHYGWVKDNVEVDDKNKPQVILTMPSNGRTAEENITRTNMDESSSDDE